MCASSHLDSDFPPWLDVGLKSAWKHRSKIGSIATMTLVIACLLCQLYPTDFSRADADICQARRRLDGLGRECVTLGEEIDKHKKQETEWRQAHNKAQHTSREWSDCCKSFADSEADLVEAKIVRTKTLLQLCSQYRRLLASAEVELIRAKDARDRGTPYPVAPRVRELLTPILANR